MTLLTIIDHTEPLTVSREDAVEVGREIVLRGLLLSRLVLAQLTVFLGSLQICLRLLAEVIRSGRLPIVVSPGLGLA